MNNLSNSKYEIEIVISRYNETLDWLKKEPFCNYYHRIYNKGNDTKFYSNFKTLEVISLKNVGRESHTYLNHICMNYDNLSKLTLFVPGSLDKNLNKLRKAEFILEQYEKTKKTNTTMIGAYYENTIRNELKDFYIDFWCSNSKKAILTDKNSILDPCPIRPFGKWLDYVFGNINAHIVPYGGVFSVSKEDIVKHKKERYSNLINILEYNNSSNPEVGHYFERCWEYVFYPLDPNSIIIKTTY
jgi:hypothetical protein